MFKDRRSRDTRKELNTSLILHNIVRIKVPFVVPLCDVET